MSKRVFTLNRKGVRELLNSPGVVDDLVKRGMAVVAAAGPGHRMEVSSNGGGAKRGAGGHFLKQSAKNRARVAVITDTAEAIRSEQKNRTLTHAINAARR